MSWAISVNRIVDRPTFTVVEDGEPYRQLLGAARRAALEIIKTPPHDLAGAARYIRASSEQLASRAQDEESQLPISVQGAIFECLARLVAIWPDLVAGKMTGEQAFSENPGLWKRAMTEWPMGGFANMAANFLIERDLLGGKVIELGAGIGSASALVANYVTGQFIRTDLQPFLLRRQKIAGTVERYDFNEPGPWNGVDTIFAVNALHCAKDKVATLRHLSAMLRPGGMIVLGEGQPYTDDNGTPWALNPFFGLFRGWWDIGGFLSRDHWFSALRQAGFSKIGFADRRAGTHDLGGIIWATK